MAKTNAELQKAYRRRTELTRLDILIEGPAKRALVRLAAQHNYPMRVILQDLVLQAERDVLATLDDAQRKAFAACQPITR